MSDLIISLKGRCLCGAVNLTAKEASRNLTACHCKMCRRWTGGAALLVDCGVNVTVDGKEELSRHQTTNLGERAFCSNCGSGLFYRYFDSNKHYVPAGLFHYDGFVLAEQIYIDEKPDYYALSNQTPTLTEKEFCNLRYGTDSIETLENYRP